MNGSTTHQIVVKVVADHIDELDHVNNAIYVQFVEQVARAHSDYLGFPVERFLAEGAIPVVRRHEIVYHSPAKVGDELALITRIVSLKGVRAVRQTEIRREGVLLVEAETEWVWVEPQSMRPTRVPAAVRDAFSPKSASDSDS